LEALPAEQRPVADHLLVGGIAAVRQALAEHNERARAAGQPQIKPDRVLVMAESLLPALRAAEWLDRAEAAAAMGDAVGLRDLRAVVAGADAAGRDDVARQLAASLREALDRRSNEARESWVSEVARSLDDGRVLRALRISARAPEAGTRFPAELAGRLAVAVATAMTSDTSSERWLALLEAVIASPIRQTVKPAGIPQDAVVTEAALRAVGRVPALGDLLGKPAQALRPPPPPPGPPDPSPAESGDRGDDAVVEEELEKPLTETAPGQIA